MRSLSTTWRWRPTDRTAKIHEDQEKAAEPAKALGFVAVAAGSGEPTSSSPSALT